MDSKLGGIPYLPKNKELPVDKEGRQLKLLAQINLQDLQGMEELPSEGLLQFFVLADECYGLDFDNSASQDTFRVIYYEQIDKNVKEEDVSKIYNPYYEDEDEWFVFEGEFKMEFEITEEGMSFEDFRYDDIFVEKYNRKFPNEPIDAFFDIDKFDSDLYDRISRENDSGEEIKIGGYPYFTQEDLREYNYNGHDTLLLQIDSFDDDDEDIHIMWGDSGVGNFFISSEDLKNRDFSNVLYNWDCY
ncbi:YwqG family protein [Intestinibacter sp.]|uniref:YwqG family protein n=1 Tax=Intestinibacter sp. TaxID=1965304 RepID=UPI002A750055|nr:YwqG family protein [Intestinibacter sp.]MDY2735693.1 YwqG family protein [Intestinibacter sp.]MDY4576315.1 YwqG family protein [Intestinibacter sp.]